jgi:polyisoprenoid-binding protein YceI
MLASLSCRMVLAIPLSLASVAHAAIVCPIDEHGSEIAFSVDYLGLFHPAGRFRHFTGRLDLDLAHPERTAVLMEVDAASIDMAWGEALDRLRSDDYFDVQHHRTIRFRSTAITPAGPGRYAVTGLLEIRGVVHPQILEAVLTRAGGEAQYLLTGTLSRSAFGMTADRGFVSDTVALSIVARIAPEARQHLAAR